MKTGQRVHIVYLAVVVALLAAAGALYFAYQKQGEEVERLVAAQRTLSADRDALKSDTQAQRERVAALEAEQAALQRKNAELASAMETLSQGLSETERKASAAAQARRAVARAEGGRANARRGQGAIGRAQQVLREPAEGQVAARSGRRRAPGRARADQEGLRGGAVPDRATHRRARHLHGTGHGLAVHHRRVFLPRRQPLAGYLQGELPSHRPPGPDLSRAGTDCAVLSQPAFAAALRRDALAEVPPRRARLESARLPVQPARFDARALEGEVAWLLPRGPKPYWRGRVRQLHHEFAN